jgi:hypothetical protein
MAPGGGRMVRATPGACFEAGRYRPEAASSILERANKFLPPTELLHEIAIKDPLTSLPWLRSMPEP